ncbi:MAG TPA: RluA family pseudouridine synthase [Gemmatimonadaceae bacterium]|nr:RluA family pseudouridine synthase [Gemmatimonadaceae bacterium]
MPGAQPVPPGRHRLDVGDAVGTRLDVLVAQRLDLSRTQAATLVATGRVTVGGRTEKGGYRVRAGETVEVDVPPPPPVRDIAAENIPLDVVYEDDELAVVNKPAGMVVHPAPGNWTGTLVNALRGRGGALSGAGGEDRAGIVHRLDKDTSGLLLVAKTDRAHRLLGTAIAQRRVTRRYAALCWGHLERDTLTIEKPIARDPRDRQRMAIVSSGRAARTDVFRLARFAGTDLLRLHLHSGRTHQIRVHLASIGHPVAGDDTYGGGGGRKLLALPPRRHFLHAAWLRLRHPTSGALLDLRAPLPADLHTSLAAAADDPSLLQLPDPLEHFGFYRVDD